MRFTPLLIGNLLYAKDRNIVGFYILALNKPGSLSKITSIFEKYGVNIHCINFPSRTKIGGKGVIFISSDFTSTDVKPELVLGELEKLDCVEEAKIVKPQFLDILADTYHFPIMDDQGSRLILMTELNMKCIVIALREHIGVGALPFLYYEGVVTGLNISDTLRKRGAATLREGLEILLLMNLVMGRYKGEIVQFKPFASNKIVIRLHDLWECEIARKYGLKEASSHLERGVIAGLIKGYIGREPKVVETRCIAKGDKYCEFMVYI